MLIKSMELSLKQIGEPMGISVVACVFMTITAMMGGSAGLICALISVLAVLFTVIAGYTKLFGSSLFGEDGTLSMTLPLSPAELIGGRLLAAVVWNMVLCVVLAVMLGILLIFAGGRLDYLYEMFAEIADGYMTSGASPLQVGIIMGFLPFAAGISTVFLGMWMLTFQCLSHQKKGGGKRSRLRRFGVKTAAAAAFILFGLFNTGTNRLMETVGNRILSMFWVQALLIVVQILLIALMYRFCRDAVSKRCDFG